jgi:signal transduction histidine kinase
MGELGRAIIGMAHTLDEDRLRIAGQLQALQTAHEALETTQSQLVRAERLAVVGKLAAGLAHEIGNPLAVLGGFLELLADPALSDADRKGAVARMGRELDRISRTVRQLLDFSRAPQLDVAGDVGEALKHTAALMAARLRDGIALHLPPLDAPAPVAFGTDALVQVLLNLWLNAADAMGGKGCIAVRLSPRPRGGVILEVEDSGPGIDEAVAARIFEPFFTTKPAGVGTGLGLAVCERIVTAAGGDISVHRGAGGGACFRLSLPGPQSPAR